MGQTLRIYAIRQVVLPTVMALLTIAFILMIQSIYQVINLLMLPDVTFLDVAKMLSLLLPSVIVFATPMAALIGSLIGVGRMTMDREILAIRASGINIFSIFAPTIGVGFLASLAIFFLSGSTIPASQYRFQVQSNQLKLALANALQPGRFYEADKLFGGDAILYFGSRDPETGKLQKIVLEREEAVTVDPKEDKGADAATTATAKAAAEPEPPAGPASSPEAKAKAKSKSKSTPAERIQKAAKAINPANERTELSLIFAATGKIDAEQHETNPDAPPDQSIVLTLENGSIHRLSADPASREYAAIRFDKLEHHDYKSGDVEKRQKTIDSASLRRQVGDLQKEIAERNEEMRGLKGGGPEAVKRIDELTRENTRTERSLGVLKKELWQRRSMWLAAFVFVLLGIPLAITVRPSGKSWGILISIALLLIYYVILQTGLTMIANARSGGVLLAMAPNLLYALLGSYIWRQTLRS